MTGAHRGVDDGDRVLQISRLRSGLADKRVQRKGGQWGIETGLHLRLDVIAAEDRSRVRNRTSALNLAIIRRAVVSVAVAWIRKCSNKRKATMSGFYDAMAAQQHRKAFSLVTTSRPSWLPTP